MFGNIVLSWRVTVLNDIYYHSYETVRDNIDQAQIYNLARFIHSALLRFL